MNCPACVAPLAAHTLDEALDCLGTIAEFLYESGLVDSDPWWPQVEDVNGPTYAAVFA